jgi:hypothetical protein
MIIPKIHILLIEDNETDAILVESDLQQAMGILTGVLKQIRWEDISNRGLYSKCGNSVVF